MPSSSARAEGLPVVGCGRLDVRGIAMRRNLAEEAQSIRLVATFLVRTCKRQGLLSEGVRLLQAASQQLRLPQGETTERLKASHVRGNDLFHRLRQQRHGVGKAPAQGIRRAQGSQPSRGNTSGRSAS